MQGWPKLWQRFTLYSLILFPFSLIMILITKVREAIGKKERINAKVICIGNVIVGGSGKTPTAIAIAKLLRGYKIAFITRGYKGKLSSKKYAIQVDPQKHSYRDVGDEPLLLSEVAPTFISADRYKAARLAASQGVQIIIMDDGLQNFSMYKDLTFLLLDYNKLGNKLVLPAGPLREAVSQAIRRSNIIITPQTNAELKTEKKTLHSSIHIKDIDALRNTRYIAFCSIAHPKQFIQTAQQAGANIIQQYLFPDHHIYSDKELNSLKEQALHLDCRLLTTTKDKVKIKNHPTLRNLTDVLEIEVILSAVGEENIQRYLTHTLDRIDN